MTHRPPGRVLFVFLDGVGLGPPGPSNPFSSTWPGLERIAGRPWLEGAWTTEADPGSVVRALDASLGVAGSPQSATGQTTLLTGRNAALLMDGHYGPWPGPTLRAVLDQGTLFHDGVRAGGAALANAYPAGFFSALEGRRPRRSAIVYAALAAGLPLADALAYERGAGVAADLDGAFFRASRSHPPDLTAPVDAASVRAEVDRLVAVATAHRFTLFDVWLTDHAGHGGDERAAIAVVARLDAFLGALAEAAPEDLTVVVTSDHGNLEDLATRRHTLARVPLIARGPGAGAFADALDLGDVAPAVRSLLATTAG